MESIETSLVPADNAQLNEVSGLQHRFDRASDRFHVASDRMNEASDRIHEKSTTALRVIQHQRPSGGKSEWTDTPHEERTLPQKVAAATYGIVTAGNVVTSYGHYNMGKSIVSAARGNYVLAVRQAFKGRMPDTVDGAAAHVTKTKSPIGAMYDSIGDNLLVSAAVIVLTAQGKIPADIAFTLAKQRAQITYENARKRALGGEINPTRETKTAMERASFYIGGILLRECKLQQGKSVQAKLIGAATTVVGEMALQKGEQAVLGLHKERKQLEASQD